ncbi:hypothetical protein EVAR_66203_1 [Eumeta japonica]|uniref:Reverse transcriptase domain-containing protein n=1 Tax=Eumeta variegata TaxID=151549 RepID=A0A4C1ZL05_EUMVA|nr:hypothetical protein EVAR_66203_1 [Eumeta japonica]
MKTEGTVPTPALKRPDMSIAFDDQKAECLADSIELQCSDNPTTWNMLEDLIITCSQQALRLVEHISEGFKVKRKTVAVFFDVAKAFDRLDNTYSSMRPIRAGVPRSTLSPLLYPRINDIPRPSSGVQLALFADDTALYPVEAVSYEPPPYHFCRRPRSLIDPPDELTIEVEKLIELNKMPIRTSVAGEAAPGAPLSEHYATPRATTRSTGATQYVLRATRYSRVTSAAHRRRSACRGRSSGARRGGAAGAAGRRACPEIVRLRDADVPAPPPSQPVAQPAGGRAARPPPPALRPLLVATIILKHFVVERFILVARCIFDTYNKSINLPQTFGKLAESILIKPVCQKAKEVHRLFDRYLKPSIKDCERQNREGYIPIRLGNATPLEVENIILGDSQDDSADNEEDSDVCSDEVDSSDDSESSLESDYE